VNAPLEGFFLLGPSTNLTSYATLPTPIIIINTSTHYEATQTLNHPQTRLVWKAKLKVMS
jgi:hypothetical protein